MTAFPTTGTSTGTDRLNLNDSIAENAQIKVDDIIILSSGTSELYDLSEEEIKIYKETNKLPEDTYMMFEILLTKDNQTESLRTAPYNVFGMQVQTDDDTQVSIGKYMAHLVDDKYDADSEGTEVIDFTKLKQMKVKKLTHIFETRPSIVAHREQSELFVEGVHYIKDTDSLGNFKHYKYAMKDHEGYQAIRAEAFENKTRVDFALVAKQPVSRTANPNRTPVITFE